jgi:hypothetical protein
LWQPAAAAVNHYDDGNNDNAFNAAAAAYHHNHANHEYSIHAITNEPYRSKDASPVYTISAAPGVGERDWS